MEQLEWRFYQMMKFEKMFNSFWYNTQTWQHDGIGRAMHSTARQLDHNWERTVICVHVLSTQDINDKHWWKSRTQLEWQILDLKSFSYNFVQCMNCKTIINIITITIIITNNNPSQWFHCYKHCVNVLFCEPQLSSSLNWMNMTSATMNDGTVKLDWTHTTRAVKLTH